MVYRLACQCGATFNVDGRAIGRYLTCPRCQERILIEGQILEPIRVYQLTCECGTSFRVEEKAIGGTFHCPKCWHKIRIHRERLAEVHGKYDRVSKAPRPSVPVEFPTGVPNPGNSS
jgi:DNA-directed RNA polymerase subunit RPC12/RpoP